MTGDPPDEITLMCAPVADDCLACHFTMGAFMEAMCNGSFAFCRRHMVEAAAWPEEAEPVLERPRYEGPPRMLRPIFPEHPLP